MVMRILITGVSGFIGSELTKVLRQRGHDVITLVRSEPKDGSERYCKPADLLSDAAGLNGIDAVVHLAGVNIVGDDGLMNVRSKSMSHVSNRRVFGRSNGRGGRAASRIFLYCRRRLLRLLWR